MAQKVPKSAIKGTANGVLFMAFFGFAWTGIGIGGLDGWGNPWLPALAVCIGITIFTLGLNLFWIANHFSNSTHQNNFQGEMRVGIGFVITFMTEMILIAVAGAIFGSTDKFEYFFPVMAIIVGVHFFPLAYLFQVTIHYVAGILLCLFAIIVPVLLPQHVVINHLHINVWSVFVGFLSGITLWVVGLSLWLTGRRMTKKGKKHVNHEEFILLSLIS